MILGQTVLEIYDCRTLLRTTTTTTTPADGPYDKNVRSGLDFIKGKLINCMFFSLNDLTDLFGIQSIHIYFGRGC